MYPNKLLEPRIGGHINARVRPTTGLVEQMLGSGPNMPGLLQKPRAGENKATGPLSGDVLRAFDTYNRGLEAAASGLKLVFVRIVCSSARKHP